MSLIYMKLQHTALILVIATGVNACSTTREIKPNATNHYSASYDFSDKNQIVDHFSQNLLEFVDIKKTPPILISYGIGNETSEQINTIGISNDIRLALVQSGKFQRVKKAQSANLTTEYRNRKTSSVPAPQRIEQSRQLGADYILIGTLRSTEKKEPGQIHLTEKQQLHYSLDLELTDTVTGAVRWTDKVEIARESSLPFFGW